MPLTFEPVTLDGNYGDNDGMLVFRDNRLLAVVVRLCADHGAAEGQWFVEKSFGRIADARIEAFEDRTALESWLVSQVEARPGY